MKKNPYRLLVSLLAIASFALVPAFAAHAGETATMSLAARTAADDPSFVYVDIIATTPEEAGTAIAALDYDPADFELMGVSTARGSYSYYVPFEGDAANGEDPFTIIAIGQDGQPEGGAVIATVELKKLAESPAPIKLSASSKILSADGEGDELPLETSGASI